MAQLVDLIKWLEVLPGQLEPQHAELQLAAEAQRDRIKARTLSGVSVDLQIFPPYSKFTRKNPPVNLFVSGEMLGSIQVAASNEEAHLFFTDSIQEGKARAHNNGAPAKHLPQRFFFGVSLQDREEIVGDIKAALFRRVNS